ncbi:MAG: class I SAM-dependent methyltransferase [Flavobacteriales bacterium]|jgi:SAM-dependent methyltransferase|nr:class I SAM-dependent methyltransferase [Flavobacteriales bacterium]
MILDKANDPMGLAILEYAQSDVPTQVRVLSPEFDEDEIPLTYLFRTYADFPPNEKNALNIAKGKILDIGAGAGIHSRFLKNQGKEIRAIDISPYSVEYLLSQNISAELVSIFDYQPQESFDTILLLMNGLGIAEKREKLPEFLQKLKSLLSQNGQILIESCSLSYLFDNPEEAQSHSGEILYQMKYKNIEGLYFYWLYLSFEDLEKEVVKENLKIEKIFQQKNGQYLAKITH